MFGLSSRVRHHSNPTSVTWHRSWSIPVSTHSDFAVFPHENVCQPSSLQSKLRSIKTRLSWLQIVIDGQESRRTLDKMSKLHRSRLDTSLCTRRSGSSQLASDENLSRTACAGTELHCKPTRSVDQLREMCPSPKLRLQCDDQLGNSSAQRNFDTDNLSLAPLCREHPPEGNDESPTRKCTDDGRGIVKTLSGRLARKLQRRASLVNAGLSKNIQTVLDAATVDRCDFVEICCSDAPCLTEAMQRCGLSSFSLLRSDGVGNHDAKTREKMLSWLSEKRPQKAWFSPLVITHQNNSTRCSFRSRQIFRQFFEYAAAVLSNMVATFFLGMACKVHRLVVCGAT